MFGRARGDGTAVMTHRYVSPHSPAGRRRPANGTPQVSAPHPPPSPRRPSGGVLRHGPAVTTDAAPGADVAPQLLRGAHEPVCRRAPSSEVPVPLHHLLVQLLDRELESGREWHAARPVRAVRRVVRVVDRGHVRRCPAVAVTSRSSSAGTAPMNSGPAGFCACVRTCSIRTALVSAAAAVMAQNGESASPRQSSKSERVPDQSMRSDPMTVAYSHMPAVSWVGDRGAGVTGTDVGGGAGVTVSRGCG